jgi:hypothetical protein
VASNASANENQYQDFRAPSPGEPPIRVPGAKPRKSGVDAVRSGFLG